MMSEAGLIRIILAIIVGVLFGLVYSMRVLILMERRMARIEMHIESMVSRLLKDDQILFSKLNVNPKKEIEKIKKTQKTIKKLKK